MIETELTKPVFMHDWQFLALFDSYECFVEARDTLLTVMQTPIARRANPVLLEDHFSYYGDKGKGFILIEFRTSNERDIANVAAFFESSIK